MRWVRRRAIRSELQTPEHVRQKIAEIRRGKGKYRNAEFEVHYDPRRVRRGRYDLVVMEKMEIPGGSICANCSNTFEPSDDYLCPHCRGAADS